MANKKGCDTCRWHALSKYAGILKCSLDQGDSLCRLYATQEEWEVMEKPVGKYLGSNQKNDPDNPSIETQIMRLGYARYNIANAAGTLNRMPLDSIPTETLKAIDDVTQKCVEIEKQLYALQRNAVFNVKRK